MPPSKFAVYIGLTATVALSITLSITLSIFLASAALAQESARIGLKLYHMESGKLLYEAERVIESADGRVTERTVFSKAGGEAIQESETVYEAAALKLITHTMNDKRLGLMEQVTVSGGKLRFTYREAKDEEPDKDEMDLVDNMIIAPTIMPLLRRNWDKIAAGEEVVFDLIVASRQGTVTFRLRKDSTAKINDEPVTVVVMEPDSFFIRALVDPMVFSAADAPPHRLLKYVGRTSVKTDEGKDQDLRVEFTY